MKTVLLNSLTAFLAVSVFMTIASAKESIAGGLFYWGYGGVKPIGDDAKRFIPTGGFNASRLGNIADVEAADTQIAIVAMHQESKQFDGFSVFLLRAGRDAKPVAIKVPGIIRASLSPDGKMVALGTCNSDGCQLEIVETDMPSTRVWKRASTQRITSVAWNPRQPTVAYVTGDDLVHIVNIGEASEIEVIGSEIGWSPTGDKLAIGRGHDIVVYDIAAKKERMLLGRAFWKTRIVGRISWSIEDVLAFNTPAGIDGNKLTCNIYDVTGGSVKTIDAGYDFCGLIRVNLVKS